MVSLSPSCSMQPASRQRCICVVNEQYRDDIRSRDSSGTASGSMSQPSRHRAFRRSITYVATVSDGVADGYLPGGGVCVAYVPRAA